MLNIAFGLLLVAAVGGLIMAGRLFLNQHPPWLLSLGHAALGVSAIVLVIISIANGGTTQRVLAAVLILGAATLGGFYLASLHANAKIPPKAIVAGHGLLAVIGVMLLGSALLQ